jgi:hypothetical protein
MQAIKKMGTVPFSHYFKEERDCPLFRVICRVSADFMNNSGDMSYSRVEVGVDSVAKSVANVAIS